MLFPAPSLGSRLLAHIKQARFQNNLWIYKSFMSLQLKQLHNNGIGMQ